MSARTTGAVGAAACVGCCVAPLLAWMAGLGLTGGALFGVVGLVGSAGLALVTMRRRARRLPGGPVSVEMGTRTTT